MKTVFHKKSARANTNASQHTADKNIKRRVTAKKVRKITEGIFSTLVDATLFTLVLPLASFGKRPSSLGVYQTFTETREFIKEVNYEAFKQALNTLRKNGLMESIKDWTNQPLITAAGRKRLENLLPQYQEKRLWDGKIYLISYDFSRKENRKRDIFRNYIKRLGAFKLQGSLYICCLNPYKHIKEFETQHRPQAVILVSELGKRGFIGEGNLKTFLWEKANLAEINDRYRDFIEKYKNSKASVFEISVSYYSILKKDPQIPYELLQDEYLGDEAYLLFKKSSK